MKIKFVEVMHRGGTGNWGKFFCGRFTREEWGRPSAVSPRWSLLAQRGWTHDHVLVFDIETGEGAIFMPGGLASADLGKHKIWVCPMFEPFLTWLYQQDLTDLDKLPGKVEFEHSEAEFGMQGYRRSGPDEDS